MKVLFLVKRFYPLIGGVEKHVLLLSGELMKRGYEITIITEWSLGENSKIKFLPKEEYQGIKIFRIPYRSSEKGKKFVIWRWLHKNKYLIQQADIVHCHDVFYWYLPFRFIFPKKNVFTTFHGYEGIDPPKSKQIIQHKIAELLSKGNICIGDFHKKWYKTKPTIVSYGAVEKKPYTDKQTLVTKKYDFCYIGRLAEDVGIMTYLKALKILKDKGQNTNLVVCGDGPQLKEAQTFAKKEKLQVTFTGFINDPIVYLKNSKTAFISRYLGILEALLEKKPVFALYNNKIKRDYLAMAEFTDWIWIGRQAGDLALVLEKKQFIANEKIELAYQWAKRQTWGKMTDNYTRLWSFK